MGANEDSSLLLRRGGANSVVVDLERRSRRRRCVALTVCTFFFVLVGVIAVWAAHVQPHTTSREASVAANALQILNKNLHAQSKVLEPGCETTVLIMRHCEKFGPYVKDNEGNFHCSYVGFERAKYIATQFGSGSERWPAPAHLFALSPDRDGHWNFREWETLHPLATKLGLTVDVAGRSDLPSEVFDLLQSGTLCGQLVAISWSHEFIPELAVALGCGPDNGCPESYPQDSFDQVWQLKYVFQPFAKQPKHEPVGGGSEPENNATRHRVLEAELYGQSKHGWNIYASVSYLNFDALAFSKTVGDYPLGGTPRGGRWDEEM